MQQDHHTKTPMGLKRRPLCCAVLGLMLLVLGCASGPTRKTSSIKSAKNVKSSAAELSSRNQSLLSLYSAEIENAADKIIFESPSAVARRQALVWKAEAIPVMQTSLLNTDPVAAVFDTWVFIFQMAAYMERPAVKEGFGELHSVVTATLKNMDTEMEHLVLVAAPAANITDLRQKAGAWAEAHPIQAGLAGRPSADPEIIRRVGESDLGTMASLKALGESLGDLAARLNSYNAYLPKQTRWQAELLLMDIRRDPQVEAVMSNFVAVSGALAKTSSSMDRMPELIGQAREAVRADVEGQRLAAQAFLRDERLETLASFRQERIATVAAMRSERLAATSDLRGERQVVLDALHNEEVAVMNDFNAASEKAIKDLDAKGRGLIDHFFLRALELGLLMVVLCFLVAWILLRRFAARRPERGERLYDRAA
jgi:hypothetical protein